MDKLVPLMEAEWEEIYRQEYGAAYMPLKHLFDEKIGEGFEIAEVNPKPMQQEYLVRISLKHLGFVDKPEAVEFGLKVREIEGYDAHERARVWEKAGEYTLWFGAMSRSDNFVNQGIDSFLGASSMLNESGSRFRQRSALDWDVGLDFQDLTEVLRKSDLCGCRYNLPSSWIENG